MPEVNPEILVWARETAGLSQETVAKRLGFQDSSASLASEKLAALECGDKEPTRPQIVKMADAYRRPLLAFYLPQPPATGDRGADFRTARSESSHESDALLDTLIRDIRSRQSMVRAVLEDEEEAYPLAFIDSHRMEDGSAAVLASLREVMSVDLAEFRAEANASDTFNLLRGNAESAGIFVLIKGDLGNYRSTIDTATFRGFSIADPVAPFVVINDNDARPAWSFTLLHETVHLLLGQTGVGSDNARNNVERFCDHVAGEFLLPEEELQKLDLDGLQNTGEVSERISHFARRTNLGRTMVAYRAFRSNMIDQDTFGRLSNTYRGQWREEQAKGGQGGPNYYAVRRHRLGGRLTNLVRRMMSSGNLSTSKAARILGVKPRQVQPLLGTIGQ